MEIQVKNSTIISPAEETPKHFLPNSPLDIVAPAVYVPTVYFYRRPNDCSDFFEADLLKEALSKVLVPFYPLSGRLRKNEDGGNEVECNGEGVLFVEAEMSCVIDDFGDFSQGAKLLPLVPTIDDIKDVFSRPLLLTQVTRFKCGGVCLGVRVLHILVDAVSAYNFVNAWAEMTRGFPITAQPFFDRTILSAGAPTSPTFHHMEYNPPPSMNTPTQKLESQSNSDSICTAFFKLSLDQMNILKEKSRKDEASVVKYSRFEILAAHIWRCVCEARALPDDQPSKLHIPTNGRFRLNPPLPSGYFGNVIFTTALTALVGEIQSESLNNTLKRIRKAINRMNNEYLKSALAYLKQQYDMTCLRRGAHTFKCPNLNIVNLMQMPMYDANFGWGRPIFTRLVNTYFEGISHIYPCATDDGSLLVTINLETHHMQLFKKLFYDI